MAADRSASTTLEFVAVAQREGLLPAESAAELSRESAEKKVAPAQLALQRGLLSPVQVEIIETLLNPRSAVAGYEILGLLGYGGMGIVYRARQLSLGRIVALKTVLLNAKTTPSKLARFEQEAQTVGRLLHPHIITAYDFGRDGNRVYFAMELVEGEDIERRIDREGPLAEGIAWGLIRQAASGLAQAAEFGIVHRDIKPANLLLVAPPKGFPLPAGMPLVKIADFGLALISDDDDERTRLTADNSMVGSPHYMAPEQLTGGEIDRRADIYALGAAAYHMLAGRPPFDGLTLPQIFAQKLNSDPVPLSSLRTGLSAETLCLVEDLMARNRDRRLDHYAQLIDRIDQLLPVTSAGVSTVTLKSLRTVSTDTRPAGGETHTSFPSFAEVLALPRPQPHSLARRVFEIAWRVGVAMLLVLGTSYGVLLWRDSFSRAELMPGVELQPSGITTDLFDGRQISTKWRIIAGVWKTETDHEGSTVLATSDGVISRRLAREIPGQPSLRLNYFRLQFLTAIRSANSIELTFGMYNPTSDSEAKSILRIERNRAILLPHAFETAPAEPQSTPLNWAAAPDQYHEVRIERQATQWRAFIDNQLVGTVPLAENEIQAFRLAVSSRNDQQPAWFADFVVEELVPP